MSVPSSFRLVVTQPAIERSAEESSRVDVAVALINEAGERGGDLVLFPESYPGPITAGLDYDAGPAIREACRQAGIAAAWGRVEPTEDGRFVTVVLLTGRNGEELGRYVRSHPATGDVHPVLSGASMAPGPEPGMFELDGLKLGVVVCSELWNPELCRVLALRGAEVLLAPAGGGFHRVAENWKLMARARAIENELYVGLTQQLFDGESGSALIAGPEDLLTEEETPGLQIVDLDLERARWLRDRDDSMEKPKPFSSLPGLLRARRPELYKELAEPRKDLYNFKEPTSNS